MERIGPNAYMCLTHEAHKVRQSYEYVGVDEDGMAVYELRTEIED